MGSGGRSFGGGRLINGKITALELIKPPKIQPFHFISAISPEPSISAIWGNGSSIVGVGQIWLPARMQER
jgi:hypothetical protein